MDKKEKIFAFAIVTLLVLTGVWAIFFTTLETKKALETGELDVVMLINTNSTRKNEALALVASDSSPYYSLIATPIAVHYAKNAKRDVTPLLVVNKEQPSTAVTNFLALYGNPNITAIGDVGDENGYLGASKIKYTIDEENLKETSLKAARYFWNTSDGALIIKEDREGYNLGVAATVLASYLNIPVIVTDSMDSAVAITLDKLKVKYTLVAGNIGGYRATKHFFDIDSITKITTQIIKERLGEEVSYITLANPMDTYKLEVLDTKSYHFSGKISDSGAPSYPGAAPIGADGPSHIFGIPTDYQHANVKVDIKMDVSKANGVPGIGNDADASGERVYAYIGIDKDKDGKLGEKDDLRFFGGTPGYDLIRDGPSGRPLYAWFYTELPFFNDATNITIQLLAKLPTYYPTYTTTYTVDITVEKLATTTYPLMPDLSSLASYLAAYRYGIVLAKPEYQIHNEGVVPGCACGTPGMPSSNENAAYNVNNKTIEIKNDLNKLLGALVNTSVKDKNAWVSLASTLNNINIEKRPHIGIIADTNMVPQYYFKTKQGGATEGFGMPSDNAYMDIDMDPANPPYDIGNKEPTFEVPVGRITGWDSQDVSALLARTFFYTDIINSHKGPNNNGVTLSSYWKDSALTTVGTEMPVGASTVTADKLGEMFLRAGFQIDESKKFERSRRQFSQDSYMSSNFIYFAVHGFYYWYVPTAWEGKYGVLPKTAGGGAYDVAHVKDMAFGPSVIFGLSCVTGRIDDLHPYNTLSQAFLHAGMNTYIGATRSAWGNGIPVPDMYEGEELGDLLGMRFYAALTGYLYDKHGGLVIKNSVENATVGVALMDAKNKFVASEGTDNGGPMDDTFNQFTIYGDPAFNPYEPNHEGRGEYIA
jgi:hypothetical protein